MRTPPPFTAVLRDGDEPAHIRLTAVDSIVAYAVDDTMAELLVSRLNGAWLLDEALCRIQQAVGRLDSPIGTEMAASIGRILDAARVAGGEL